MNKKFGLGKGLGALIPEEVKKEESILKVDMNLIKPNNDQPRKSFDQEKIIQLADSIKEHGIIQPVVLRKEEEIYMLIAGERRWRAAKHIGLKEIPAVILDLDDRKLLEVSLIENIQREDLNPIEEAIAYKKLIEDFSLTQEELSKRIGKSRVSISNCMRLLNLDSRVQEYLVDNVITEGHGRALLAIEDKNLQYEISQKIIDEELSVRQVEALIKNIKTDKLNRIKNKIEDTTPYYNDLKSKLENLFNTKVLFNHSGDKGKIQIEYYSEEDLQRIIEILKI